MTLNDRTTIWRPSPRDDVEPPFQAAEVAAWKRRVYTNFDIYSFDRRRKNFWDSDFSAPSFNIIKEVENVLRVSPRGQLLVPFNWDEIPVGTELWRARRIECAASKPLKITVGDLWEPPAHVASPGRMNTAGEPLLYSCINLPIDTLSEARILEPDSHFILIGYEVTQPLRVKRIGTTHDPTLTRRQQKIETKISEFLAQVVSIPADSVGASTYEHTQKILRQFYVLEPGWESGWIYWSTLATAENRPWSVVDPLNVALEPSAAHDKLQVRHVVFGTQHGYDDHKHHLALHSFADTKINQGGYLEFNDFPHTEFSSVQDYFDFLD